MKQKNLKRTGFVFDYKELRKDKQWNVESFSIAIQLMICIVLYKQWSVESFSNQL
jgi:hypothetical protein